VDTYSNVYVSGGVTLGLETPFLAGFSIRSSGGYIIGERNASGYGPLLDLNRNGTPTEAQLEDLNRGLSIGGGADLSQDQMLQLQLRMIQQMCQ